VVVESERGPDGYVALTVCCSSVVFRSARWAQSVFETGSVPSAWLCFSGRWPWLHQFDQKVGHHRHRVDVGFDL